MTTNDQRLALRADMEREAGALCELLEAKNRAYGDSALEPLGLLTETNVPTGLKVRAEDKLKRWRTADPADREDVLLDLMGYLGLLALAEAEVTNLPTFGVRRIRSGVPREERFIALRQALGYEVARYDSGARADVFTRSTWTAADQCAVIDWLLVHHRGHTLPILLELLHYRVRFQTEAA